jgi:hypothetical protein
MDPFVNIKNTSFAVLPRSRLIVSVVNEGSESPSVEQEKKINVPTENNEKRMFFKFIVSPV